MILDDTTATIILEISKKQNLDKNVVLDIVTAYNKGIQHIIEEKSPATIKMDFFGRLSFNHLIKKKDA